MTPKNMHPNEKNCCQEHDTVNHGACCKGDQAECCKSYEQDNQSECCISYEHSHNTCCQSDPMAPSECCGTYENDRSTAEKEPPSLEVDPADELKKLQSTFAATHEKYLRLYSEFDNFKKRTDKERLLIAKRANQQTLIELLPIIDVFERSLATFQNQDCNLAVDTATQEGIQLIYEKQRALLTKFGVQEMYIEPGSAFNANCHEGITTKAVNDPAMKGKVIEVVAKGYLINDEVLRFAQVVTEE